ncbi:MAG: deoxyribodipyrimidine photo-lyase [Ignavibacteria bacterium]|nr:deoxyribodipyrimidine photo-lyase [Ignavibacteria bacterium]
MLYVYWFRKDLRLEDNKGLSEFLSNVSAGNNFSLIYIKNKNTFSYFGEKRISFLNNSLSELELSLTSGNLHLQKFYGKSTEIFRSLTEKYGDINLYYNKQIEPYCIKRDILVKEIIETSGGKVFEYNDTCIFEPGEIKNDSGEQYRVYTPFKKNALSRLEKIHYGKINTGLNIIDCGNEVIVDIKSDSEGNTGISGKTEQTFISGGRKEGLSFLKEFYTSGISEYKNKRDIPSVKGTSKLSAHLHFGTVSIREALRTAIAALEKSKNEPDATGIQTWINELLWREFYYHITFFNPRLISESFRKEYDDLNWSYDDIHFEKWCKGMTGYPIVDAGMRQLNSEGWLHNRVRMIVAMFLTKDLFIDWRLGEKYFADRLIDLDFASNNGGWQWCASTGVDAQPYFRIFNPYLQSKKFDPDGIYIKKYIPELKDLPSDLIHEPDLMSESEQKKYNVIIDKNYPRRMVDHSKVRDKVITEFKKINKN